MSSQERGYWFAAKRYGWGWGLPSRWQGWVVLIGYLGSVLLGIYVGRKEENPQILFGYLAFITIVFVVVVVSKGEPPWRRSQKQ